MSKVLLNIRTREAKVEAESSVRYHVWCLGISKLGPTVGKLLAEGTQPGGIAKTKYHERRNENHEHSCLKELAGWHFSSSEKAKKLKDSNIDTQLPAQKY
jgi:hypothetical protein